MIHQLPASLLSCTGILWLFNIAMETCPCIDGLWRFTYDFPIKNGEEFQFPKRSITKGAIIECFLEWFSFRKSSPEWFSPCFFPCFFWAFSVEHGPSNPWIVPWNIAAGCASTSWVWSIPSAALLRRRSEMVGAVKRDWRRKKKIELEILFFFNIIYICVIYIYMWYYVIIMWSIYIIDHLIIKCFLDHLIIKCF